jgi:hypothetical protein
MEVNNGEDPRIKTSTGIHGINPEECDVYSSLLESCLSGVITPCVNHTMTKNGDVEGFRFTCAPEETARCLPINRRMFFRTSMIECNMEDGRMQGGHNNLALSMLLDQSNIVTKLGDLVKKIHQDSIGNEVTFDCMPDNIDSVHTSATEIMQGKVSEPMLGSFMCRRATDCKVLFWLFRCCSFVVVLS